MEMEANEVSINGVEYVKKGTDDTRKAESLDGLDYCIVRTYSAGVFAGYIKEIIGQEIKILKARRLWYWKGAASLSQLSIDGVSCPEDCKFPAEVDYVFLTQVIEILPCTEKARLNIKSVKIWKA
jgi:hypothetical protein